MWKEKLGGLPIELYTYQKKGEIVPSLKGATRSRIDRRMKILKANEIFKTNEILEDLFYREVITKYQVHFKDSHGTPTEWADLLKDIKTEYSRLSKRGNTHYGRYQTIEPLFRYLFYKQLLKYPDSRWNINPIVSEVDASENAVWGVLNPDKYKNAKKILSNRKHIYHIPYVQDLSLAYVLTAYDKWEKSFTIFEGSLSETDRRKRLLKIFWLFEFLRRVMCTKGNELRERVAEEGLTDKRGIYPCLVMYAIHPLERDANKKILKTNKTLSQIWGISLKTFDRRMSELLSIDC